MLLDRTHAFDLDVAGNDPRKRPTQIGGKFVATQFYADIEGHPDDGNVRNAMDELRFFSTQLRILGTYKAHPMRGALLGGGAQ